MLIVMAGVATIVFFITRVIPADPVGAILGGNAPIELVDKMRHQLGLDKPIHLQFVDYLNGIVHGDFGVSLKTKRPIIDDIKEFFPATIELATASILITIVFGIILGILSAVHRNKFIDHILRIFSIMGVSMPVTLEQAVKAPILISLSLYFSSSALRTSRSMSRSIRLRYLTR